MIIIKLLRKERERKRSRLQRLKNQQGNYKILLLEDRLSQKQAYDVKKKKKYEKLFYTVDGL